MKIVNLIINFFLLCFYLPENEMGVKAGNSEKKYIMQGKLYDAAKTCGLVNFAHLMNETLMSLCCVTQWRNYINKDQKIKI